MEFNSGGLDGIESAWKEVSERIMEGKRRAILYDQAVECAQSLASFKAQHFPGQFSHDVTQGGAEKRATAGFKNLIIEGFIGRLAIPQVVELAM
jgi:hypothetical protein